MDLSKSHDDDDGDDDDVDDGNDDGDGDDCCEGDDGLAEDVSSHFVYTASRRRRTNSIDKIPIFYFIHR